MLAHERRLYRFSCSATLEFAVESDCYAGARKLAEAYIADNLGGITIDESLGGVTVAPDGGEYLVFEDVNPDQEA